jgi:hypothetical protein
MYIAPRGNCEPGAHSALGSAGAVKDAPRIGCRRTQVFRASIASRLAAGSRRRRFAACRLCLPPRDLPPRDLPVATCPLRLAAARRAAARPARCTAAPPAMVSPLTGTRTTGSTRSASLSVTRRLHRSK